MAFSLTAALRIAALCCSVAAGAAVADPALPAAPRPALLMTDALDRGGLDLSGDWAYSKDLYRTGQTDINGNPASPRAQRFRDIDVPAAENADPNALFEYDMHNGPHARLPGAWNAQEPTLRYYDGLIWYQRHFAPEPLNGRRAFLRFEAVNYRVDVYLNGKWIGAHEGGFTPFTLEVTGALRPGDNQITLGVDSTHDDQTIPPKVTDWDIYGGVTRPIHLIYTPATYIDDAFIRLKDDGRIEATAHLNGAAMGARPVTLEIGALGLKLAGRTDAQGDVRFDFAAPNGLKLWSPDSPTLYDVRFSAGDDHLTDRVGFRTIKVSGEHILLNGKPIFLRGISMHEEEFGANPARIITPDAARALLLEIKNGLHGNYVRLSHYPHSEVTTRLADELGLLVWSEIPVYWSVDFSSAKTLQTARAMLAENILRDRNRASIIIWSVGNETPATEARNRFLGTLAADVRRLDGSRLVSAALLVSHKIVDGHIQMTVDDPLVPELDVMAVNTYNGWYGDDHLSDVPSTVWKMPAGKPLLFSEFGADALAGFHDPVRAPKFSEDYQAAYYRATLAMADKIPALNGMSPWVLKDFQSPRRDHPVYQKGWNRKGLVSETGIRKAAFDILAAYYLQKAQK